MKLHPQHLRQLPWLLIPLLVLGIYLSSLNLASTFFVLENYRRESLWSMVQLNSQLEATWYETQLYTSGDLTYQQLRFRYELLWSRLPIAISSLESDPILSKVEGFSGLIHETFKHVRQMESLFYEEQSLDHQKLLNWALQLKHYREGITNYLIHEVSDADGQYARAAWQRLLQSIYALGAYVLAFIVLLGYFLFSLLHEQDQQRSRLEHDSLTGLYSRDYTLTLIKDYCRQRTDFMLVFIDLNKFKAVNDTYGHHVGDQLLIYLAKQFKKTLSTIGKVGRIGGDEFIWLIPNDNQRAAERTHLLLLNKLAIPLQVESYALKASISAGGIHAASSAYDATLMLELGDKAMYRAKLAGLQEIVWLNEFSAETQLPLSDTHPAMYYPDSANTRAALAKLPHAKHHQG